MIDPENKIRDSEIFVSLLSKSYLENPKTLMELAYAMVLDKPIGLLVPIGMTYPIKIRSIADAIELYDSEDPNSLELATKRLAESMIKHV